MAAGAAGHQDQAIDARLQRLFRVADRNHIVQHDAAIAVDGVEHFLGRRAQRGNDDGNPVFHAHFHVMRQAVVRLVHDLVDGDRSHFFIGIGGLEGGQFGLQLREPGVEQFGGTRVQGREGTDDTGLALRRDEGRAAGDEHRRGDNG